MGIETYILVLVCYAIGCMLSYKLGKNSQTREAIKWTVQICAEHFKVDHAELIKTLAEERTKKALKS